MSSPAEINAQIEEYEEKIKEYQQKIKELKKEKFKPNFIKYFEIDNKTKKKLKNLTVKAEYEWNDHTNDQYGHDAHAYLKVTFDDKQCLEVDYREEQGDAAGDRYMPVVYCEVKATQLASKLLFQNFSEIEEEDYDHLDAHKEFRDIIEKIVTE